MHVTALLLITLVPAAPTPARISTPGRDAALGRRYFKEGRQLFQAKRFQEAITALEKALHHWPRREIHFNIAACYHALKDELGTATQLRAYLRGAADPARERAKLPKEFRRLLKRVGVVVVQVARPELDIWVNGRKVGRRRVEAVVYPGDAAVEIKRGARTVAHKKLRVLAGSVVHWQIDKVVLRNEARPRDKAVPVGEGPRTGLDNDKGRAKSRPSRRRVHWAWFAATAALAAIAAGTAAGLGVKTQDLHDEFVTDRTLDRRDEGLRYQHATNALWGVAGAAVLSSAVIAIFTGWRRERSSPRAVVPVVTPTGVAVTGTF